MIGPSQKIIENPPPRQQLVHVEKETGHLIFKIEDGQGGTIQKKYRIKVMKGDKEIVVSEDKIQLSQSVAELINKKWEPTKLPHQDFSKYIITKSAITDSETKTSIRLDPNDFDKINAFILNILKSERKTESIKPKPLEEIKITKTEVYKSWAITNFFKSALSKANNLIFGEAPDEPIIEEDNPKIVQEDLSEKQIILEEVIKEEVIKEEKLEQEILETQIAKKNLEKQKTETKEIELEEKLVRELATTKNINDIIKPISPDPEEVKKIKSDSINNDDGKKQE